MKQLLFLLSLIVLAGSGKAQTYQCEVEMRNFTQINETEFSWEIYLRKAPTSNTFALYSMQVLLSYNQALKNGGAFESEFLTLDPTGTGLFQESVWWDSNNLVSVTNGTLINWYTVSCPVPGDNVTLIDDTWRKVARFNAQLRKNGQPHHFADVAHGLTFANYNVLVLRCGGYSGANPNAVMVGSTNENVPISSLVPAAGTPVNDRELAGYCFSGTGLWSDNSKWNTTTAENTHSIPSNLNNVLVTGSVQLAGSASVHDLTLVTGSYLVLGPEAALTTNKLFNDNPVGAGGGSPETIAGWDFQSATPGTNQFPYLASSGNTLNQGVAAVTTTATASTSFDYSSTGGSIAPRAQNWFFYDEDLNSYTYYSWVIGVNTTGYQTLTISSKQRSASTGPLSFKLQWSLDGAAWTDVTNGAITTDATWTTGVLANLALPSALDNQSTTYLRWLCTSNNGLGSSAIDDITLTGTMLPTGLLIQSGVSSTGSLIHQSTGVHGNIQRYIAGATWTPDGWNDGWHFVSSPVADQPISPEFTTTPVSNYDFYAWYEPSNLWVNFKNSTTSPTFSEANGGSNNFQLGRAYLAAYAQAETREFSGNINISDISLTGLGVATGINNSWHLLGNPFASSLIWYDGWTLNQIAGVAGVWNTIGKSYAPVNPGEPIPVGQGFMVRVLTGPGSLTIPAVQRIHSTQSFLKTVNYPVLKFFAHCDDALSFQESQIRFNPNSSNEIESDTDGPFLPGDAPQFYSFWQGQNLLVNTLPVCEPGLVIPFHFIKSEGSQYHIEVIGANELNLPVFLLDKQLNQIQNLSLQPNYSFYSITGDPVDRFEIHFGFVTAFPNPVADRHLNICVLNGAILITGLLPEDNILVFNLMGEVLLSSDSENSQKSLPVSCFPSGPVVVKIQNEDFNYVQKVVIVNH